MHRTLCRPRFGSAAALITAVCLLGTVAATPACAADEGKWADLLPENNLTEHWTTTGNWNIDDEGVVALEPREGESGWSRWDAYLWSKEQYEDFEIKFEYRPEKNSNSGFYFRVGDKDDPVAQGIEVQIYDSHGKAEDKLTDHDSGGVIPGVPPKKNTAKPAGEWSQFHITVKDDQLTVRLNGEVVNQLDLDTPPLNTRPDKGYIGFQDHALPLALRNIQIRKL